MGCNNTAVKEEVLNEMEKNKSQEKKNQDDLESNLEGDNNDNDEDENNKNNKLGKIKNNNYNDNSNSIHEIEKGVLNLYTNKITKSIIYKVPNIIILNPKRPEDKKPPDLTKLKRKKKKEVKSKE